MNVTFEGLQERRARRKKALDSALQKILSQLREMGALKVIVFGSYAADRTGSSSDLDIIVIMPPPQTGRQWMSRIYSEIDRPVDADILAFTPLELAAALPASSFIRRALETGKVLYEA